MTWRWLRALWRPLRKRPAEREWRLLADGVPIAALRRPRAADMSWISVKIVPLTDPPDPRLADDAFWLHGTWTIVDRRSGRPAPLAVASASGLRRRERRIAIRGLDAG